MKKRQMIDVEYADFVKMIEKPMEDDNKLKRVEIIILKYKSPEIEKECINRIIEHTNHPYKLNIFDNRPNSANTSKIWNKLVKEATCDLILIMDSDALVTPGWLEPLVAAMDNPDCAMSVPSMGVSRATPIQEMHDKSAPERVVKSHMSGFCFLIHKERFNKLGDFDERFYVYGEDSEFCDRIIYKSDYHIYFCPASLVYHGTCANQSENIWKTSYSVIKAEEDGELDVSLDRQYARLLYELIHNEYIDRQDLIDKFFKDEGAYTGS